MEGFDKQRVQIRWSIFVPISLLFVAAILLGLFQPEAFYNAENAVVQFAFLNFGWLFQISGVLFLLIVLYLGYSRIGNIRFGGPDAKPELTNWQWFSILLCAGIGTGIMFWGVAEPMTHFMSPPDKLGLAPGTEGSATFAMVTTFIHWTFIPYAMYTICGVAIAFAAYNMKLPYNVSSSLYPVFGKRIQGPVATLVDGVCLFSIAGGVSAILGVGTMQTASGIKLLLPGLVGDPRSVWVYVLAAIVTVYLVSSYTGLMKGMRLMSDVNTKLYFVMMVFFFFAGGLPMTQFILNLMTQSLGVFVGDFFVRTTYLSPVDGSEWPRWWPVYYWAIWVAYAPLMGMFFAKLCRGRTIREFVNFNLIFPCLFGILWFSIFGGASIFKELHGGAIWAMQKSGGLEVSVFAFLKNFPLSQMWSWIFIFVLILSIVTLCDSITRTVASLSTTIAHKEGVEPPVSLKLFWGLAMSSMALVNILAPAGKISGIDATKQIATVAGFPTLFLMLLMAFSVVRMVAKQDRYDLANCPKTAQVEEIADQ